MEKTYFISDLHFFHKNVTQAGGDYDKRGFLNLEEMHEVLINKWNNKVDDDDHIYILGDFIWKNTENSVELVNSLKGYKHLITGNHDRIQNLEYQKCFQEITTYKEMWVSVKGSDDIKVIMSHYPMMFYRAQHHNSVMLYGHVHNSVEEEIFQKFGQELINKYNIPFNAYNVGCMMPYIGFEPCTLDEILKNNRNKHFNK